MSRPCFRLLPAALIAAAAAVLLASGCGDETPPSQPQVASCVVEGRLMRYSPGGDEVRVRFLRLGAATVDVQQQVDEAGHYRFELPAGEYVASVRIAYGWFWLAGDDGITMDSGNADTLRLAAASSPARVDFPFGAVRLTGAVPAGMAAPELGVRFDRLNESGGFTYQVRRVETSVPDGVIALDSGPLPPGDYRIQFDWNLDSNHNGEEYWLPGVATPDSALWYHVGADSLREVIVAGPATAARLEGRITGAWQAMGANGLGLEAWDLHGNRVAGPWRPEPDGRFALEFHRPVPVKLAVSDGGRDYWLGGPREVDAAVFAPTPGQTIAGIEAAIPGAIVRVTTAEPGLTVDYTTLEFRDPADQSLVMSVGASPRTVNALECLLPGQYLLRVASGEFGRTTARSQWYDRAATPAAATLVNVPGDGGVLHLDITLERGGSIGGAIAPATGDRDWNRIIITGAGSDVVLGGAYLLGGVDFLLQGLEDGAYKVGVRDRDIPYPFVGEPAPAGIVWYPGTLDWQAATPIEIDAAGSVDGLVIPLP